MIANFFADMQRDTQLRKIAVTHGGEWAGPCPFCGGKDRFHVQPGENRWLCRGCTGGKWQNPVAYYIRRDGRRPDQIQVITRREEKPKEYAWRSDPWALIRQYEAHPQRFELWQKHKPLSRESIERNHLGVGVLPACSCHHERLIVPVLSGTMVVGLRGRRLACNCEGKWKPAAGTLLDTLPLYNEQALRLGCVVWLLENCVDALLLSERTEYVGLAIYSTSYWRDAWLEPLKAARPEMVIVALDNDLVGNGGAERRDEFIAEWLKTHPSIPEAKGPALVNRLQKAGLPALLFDWKKSEFRADIGSLLMGASA